MTRCSMYGCEKKAIWELMGFEYCNEHSGLTLPCRILLTYIYIYLIIVYPWDKGE
jgi:hypothetical protein